ncbi:alpha-actinin [Tritrichomonas musculus]|uniref:Alpha-actinin n=1 Tax=Tritrichomonas musculus TaxID=1915356 RepID=A0ABR2L111_9EUKA
MSATQFQESIPLQVKVFSRWVSNQLVEGKADVQVQDISKDLSNGVALVELSKVLTGKEPKREWAKTPTKSVEMIKNSDLSVQQFFEDGVHLIGIAGKDIHDNNVKIIRGYIWTLIERYSIGRAAYGDLHKKNTKARSFNDLLLEWATEHISTHPNLNNLQPFSLAMCALLDSYAPDKINYSSLNPGDSQHNAQLAHDVMKELGIPVFLLPEDYEGDMDIKCFLTQIAAARIVLEKLPPVPAVKIEENRIISSVADCIPVEKPEPKPAPKPAPKPEPKPAPAPAPAKDVNDNSQYAGRTFGLIMTLKDKDYNNGREVNLKKPETHSGQDVKLALEMVKDKHPFLNPAGLKLSIGQPNIENDIFQQFVFGQGENNTIIDSCQQRGMVWDVADEENLNPPPETPFYLFPFHGRHNQHFIYKNNMIYAKQNGHVVTYIGGDEPFVMMPPSENLKARQTFTIQLL